MDDWYLREYLSKRCSGQLQGLFSLSANPVEEIRACMAAYRTMAQLVCMRREDALYLCVGDGPLALTGALFAFLSKGEVISIDPKLDEGTVQAWMETEQVERFSAWKLTYRRPLRSCGMLRTTRSMTLFVCTHMRICRCF
jgi:hypothetical protein